MMEHEISGFLHTQSAPHLSLNFYDTNCKSSRGANSAVFIIDSNSWFVRPIPSDTYKILYEFVPGDMYGRYAEVLRA